MQKLYRYLVTITECLKLANVLHCCKATPVHWQNAKALCHVRIYKKCNVVIYLLLRIRVLLRAFSGTDCLAHVRLLTFFNWLNVIPKTIVLSRAHEVCKAGTSIFLQFPDEVVIRSVIVVLGNQLPAPNPAWADTLTPFSHQPQHHWKPKFFSVFLFVFIKLSETTWLLHLAPFRLPSSRPNAADLQSLYPIGYRIWNCVTTADDWVHTVDATKLSANILIIFSFQTFRMQS